MNILDRINQWVKSAEEAPTTHPSGSADDQTQAASVGSRGTENESDVKDQVPGQSVNDASGSDAEGAGQGENAPVHSIGTTSAATGEDSANETGSARSVLPDPGSTHPARTDNSEIGDGEKYATLRKLGANILADISIAQAVGVVPATKVAKHDEDTKPSDADDKDESKKDESKKDDSKSEDGEKETKDDSYDESMKEAEVAGAKVAKVLSDAVVPVNEKAAANLLGIIKKAEHDAAEACDYLEAYVKSSMEPGLEEALGEGEPDDDTEGGEGAVTAGDVVEPEGASEGIPTGEPEGEGSDVVEALATALIEADVNPEELAAVLGGGDAEALPEEAMAVPEGAMVGPEGAIPGPEGAAESPEDALIAAQMGGLIPEASWKKMDKAAKVAYVKSEISKISKASA